MSGFRSTSSFAPTLPPSADYAGSRGIQLGLEALNRYEASVLNTVAQTLEAISPLPDTIGIMLDSYHLNIEEADPLAAIALAGPRRPLAPKTRDPNADSAR
jgi:D-psicose/D-tagatose/L-ribulose 3-epimerase